MSLYRALAQGTVILIARLVMLATRLAATSKAEGFQELLGVIMLAQGALGLLRSELFDGSSRMLTVSIYLSH